MGNQYKAITWQTLEIFNPPIPAREVDMTDCFTNPKFPTGIAGIVKASWDRQLTAKKAELEKKEPDKKFEIKPYGGMGLNALYLGDELKMWPGTALTLYNWEVDRRAGSVTLHVAGTSFPSINALKEPEVIALYKNHKIKIPRPALAICTIAKGVDDKLILTVRGPRTNMYPGRVYGQGGNPKSVMPIDVHQREEMSKEIIVLPEEYDCKPGFEFCGLIEDNEAIPRKPDLVGYIDINLESGVVAERVRKRHSKGKSPNDAVDVEFVDASNGGLMDYLARQPPEHFCPPAQGNLVLYGASEFGGGWVRNLKKKVDWLQEIPNGL